MANNFYFKFNYREWLVSTAGMEEDERGWYINLLCHQADKQCLPNDVEKLAEFAGVRFSKYQRFEECWKRTLKNKFILNEDGMLENLKLSSVLKDREEYTALQSKRATIGAFIKKKRKENELSNNQWSEVSKDLMNCDFDNKTKKEIYNALSIRFKHTLKAVINNYNYNYKNLTMEKGGVGEKTDEPYLFLTVNDPEKINTFEMQNKKLFNGKWDVFIANFNANVIQKDIPFESIKLISELNRLKANWNFEPKQSKKDEPTINRQTESTIVSNIQGWGSKPN